MSSLSKADRTALLHAATAMCAIGKSPRARGKTLRSLAERGLLEESGGGFRITDAGRAAIAGDLEAPVLEATLDFCHACDRETRWTPIRGGKRLRCSGCRTVFPCYGDCAHLDCADARRRAS